MELTELKGLVKKHDNQLDHMLQLNSETIKKIQLQKPQRNINTTLRKRIFEVISLRLLRSVRVCISLQT